MQKKNNNMTLSENDDIDEVGLDDKVDSDDFDDNKVVLVDLVMELRSNLVDEISMIFLVTL
jgi:hypothetical protein